jgi:hypothetical protein
MTIVICPGVHPPAFTQSFLKGLDIQPQRLLVFPADRHPPYSIYHLMQFLQAMVPEQTSESLLFIGFSAGVVAAMGAANLWQLAKGEVTAVIALDGWGVPQLGSIPLYRLSHDAFTAWSSAWLGGQPFSFYADPPVAHLELWRSPQTTQGWLMQAPEKDKITSCLVASAPTYYRTTAAQVLRNLLKQHGEI